MSATTVTSRKFECDHCGKFQTFYTDADAGKAGWALLDVNGKEYALCRDHYEDLKSFLHKGTFKPIVTQLEAHDNGA